MQAVEVVEVDVEQLAGRDRRAIVEFEQVMWAEHAPDDQAMAEEPAWWMATRAHPNATRATWLVRHRPNGGGIAGVATLRLPTLDNPHLGEVELRVAPPHRRQGIGCALLAVVAAQAKREGRRVLVGSTWDLAPAGEAFAHGAGAAAKQVVRRSDLDLRRLDRRLVARWLDVGDDVGRRYDLWPVIGPYPPDRYDAIAEAEEVMNSAPHGDLDVDAVVIDADWVAQREQQQARSPGERWTLFARERATQRLVGYTQVFFYADWPGHVDQGNTGVHPDHRGHGLGRWLKAAMVERILDVKPESARIRTMNAFSNAPMLAINDELGFVVTATQTVWEADVDDVLRRPLRRR